MSTKRRVLAVVSHFKHTHVYYLAALARHVDLQVAWSHEAHAGSVEEGIKYGLRMTELGTLRETRLKHRLKNAAFDLFRGRLLVGVGSVESRLRSLLVGWQPQVVHLMYYYHDELTVLVRGIAGSTVRVIYECRDPITTLRNAPSGSQTWNVEGTALRAADRHIFVSRALREYLERAHRIDLKPTSLLVPHVFPGSTAGDLSQKLSARDGRVHIALVGTTDPWPDYGRWYGDIIRRLLSFGFVVHTHFHELPDRSLDVYRALAKEFPDYHFHPTVTLRRGTILSELTSRYDLMGVFHELQARHHNESATLKVCMPTKAVSGWFHGAIPVVTFSFYRGLVDLIEEHGIGFVIDRWEDLRAIAADRGAIGRATENCRALRHTFSCEYQAQRVAEFYESCVTQQT